VQIALDYRVKRGNDVVMAAGSTTPSAACPSHDFWATARALPHADSATAQCIAPYISSAPHHPPALPHARHEIFEIVRATSERVNREIQKREIIPTPPTSAAACPSRDIRDRASDKRARESRNPRKNEGAVHWKKTAPPRATAGEGKHGGVPGSTRGDMGTSGSFYESR